MLINANGVDGIKCYDTVKRPGGVLVAYRTLIKTPDTQTSLCALAEAHVSSARQPSLTSLWQSEVYPEFVFAQQFHGEELKWPWWGLLCTHGPMLRPARPIRRRPSRCFSVQGFQKMTYEVLCTNSPPGITLPRAACDAKRLQMCPFSPKAPPQRVRTSGLNAIKPGVTHKTK